MKLAKSLGLTSALFGVGIGSYYCFSAVQEVFNFSTVSAHQMGIYSAISATIVGLSLAVIGVIYNHSNNNT